jgi:DNA processing protein
MNSEVFYGMALSLLKGVGHSNAKTLISYAGSAENLFKLSPSRLQKINGIGPKIAASFKETADALRRAEQELKYVEKNHIDVLFYYDKRYPKRLLNCADAPLFIFTQGKYDFNKDRFVSIIGTRHASVHGRELTEKLVAELAEFNISLVSGLAFGIDICAHKAALKYPMQNIAVLAHGLDRIYPNQHRGYAERMQENGALVTEFFTETTPDRQNFPSRNRIVAGMTDATIVVESAVTGGALITAEIANSYNKDVFAFPGRVSDEYAQGCLKLIKTHKANLITGAQDIIEFMNWDIEAKPAAPKSVQPLLFTELNEDEQQICSVLKSKEQLHIDELFLLVQLPNSKVTGILLQLEMKGVVSALPGKLFKLTG